MLRTLMIFAVGFSFISSCLAQELPDTDILIFSFQTKNKLWKLIKKHDSLTYENQLHFTDNKNYLFVKKNQSYTSVFRSKVKSKKETSLIKDTMNLFSPFQINKHEIQLIVQDKQNKQYIARYKFEKTRLIKKIILQSEMAGYHAYLNPDTLVFYHVGDDEHRISVYLNDSTILTAGKSPAACLYKSGPYEFLWMHKSEKGNLIFEYSLTLRKNRLIMNIEKGTDYFYFNHQKNILIIRNKQMEFYDLQANFIQSYSLPESLKDKNIKRFYHSPNKKYFAFVISKDE